MNVEVVGFEVSNDGDMRRFLKVPKLKTRKFVDDDGVVSELIKNI